MKKNNPQGCDEQADIPGAMTYIPCGRKTDGKQFKHKQTGEGPYFFCDWHQDHNIRRGFVEVTNAKG